MIPQREPDLECGVLRVWVISRQFPESDDFWDGNWLNVVARCEENGASVTVSGPVLHLGEVETFLRELEAINKNLKGSAALPTIEPNLGLALECNELGHLKGTCEITPDHMTQEHRFEFDSDQTYLKGYISQCRGILSNYRIKDPKQKSQRGSGYKG